MHIRYNKLFSLENNNFKKLILFLIFHYHPSTEEVKNVKKKSKIFTERFWTKWDQSRWDYHYYNNNVKSTDRPRSTYYVTPLLAVAAFLPF